MRHPRAGAAGRGRRTAAAGSCAYAARGGPAGASARTPVVVAAPVRGSGVARTRGRGAPLVATTKGGRAGGGRPRGGVRTALTRAVSLEEPEAEGGEEEADPAGEVAVKAKLEAALPAGLDPDRDLERGKFTWTGQGTPAGMPEPTTARERDLLEFLDGTYDGAALRAYFRVRPATTTLRLAQLARVFARVYSVWQREEGLPPEKRTRGAVLREGVNELGPVFIKMGQTLSSRADLIGQEAADALIVLQDGTEPFPKEDAFRNMADALDWDGPIAPGIPGPWAGDEARCVDADYLFRELSKEPVASASIGQVYRGFTWEGDEIAVKVQRPEILWEVALDMYVLIVGLDWLKRWWGSMVDLTLIADEVGAGLWRELDYRQEAKNGDEFEKVHSFLGYVKTPKWLPKYTTARVLTMEWCDGKKLSELPLDKKLDFMSKAIETSACMILESGCVHADPHEGNILYKEDTGELFFIDFGLIAKVQPRLMEGFASGCVHLIAGNWLAMADDFKLMELVGDDFVKFNPDGSQTPCTIEDFCGALQDVLNSSQDGDGPKQFGDLVLSCAALADSYKFLCPPYTILLVRTFATLEGMAAKVDDSFNMYEACFPYAIRRGLAPITEEGKAALRETLLDDQNRLNVDNFRQTFELVQKLQEGQDEEKKESANPELEGISDGVANRAAAVVGGLAFATEGSTLRRLAYEADSLALADELLQSVTPKSVKMFTSLVSTALKDKLVNMGKKEEEEVSITKPEIKRSAYSTQALFKILGKHFSDIYRGGFRGLSYLARFAWISTRIGVSASVRGSVSAALLAIATFFSKIGSFFDKAAAWSLGSSG